MQSLLRANRPFRRGKRSSLLHRNLSLEEERMADGTVTRVSECLVRPSSATARHNMFLSAGDFIWRHFHYNQRILFFSLPSPCRSDAIAARLKSSLSLALVEFFPWAARAVEQENGRLALDCNDEGVLFIEARVDLPFSRFAETGFEYRPLFEQFAPHVDVNGQDHQGLPLLFVQVTIFPGDEGFVLGISHSHIIADGSSLWHFMKSWGECARGVPLSMHPVHMREALGPDYLILPSPLAQDDDGEPGWPKPPLGKNGRQEKVQHNFHFTSDMVKKLKSMAASSCLTEHAPFSSLQVLSAHFWKHMIAVKDVDNSRKSIYNVISNMRSRLNPPLPENYFGNVLLREGAIATKEELQNESLGATALRIQRLIKTLDETFLRTLYGKVEVWPFHKIMEGMDFSMVMFQLSSSPRFPVYDVDFGWGPALSVQCPKIPGLGETVWFPGREGDGSIDVALALEGPDMKRLEQDESFLSF